MKVDVPEEILQDDEVEKINTEVSFIIHYYIEM